MKAKINGIEIEGEVSEIIQMINLMQKNNPQKRTPTGRLPNKMVD